jgi:D-3-phosphoglycerate dehydrogenase
MKRLNVIYLKDEGDDPLWNEVMTSTIAESHDVSTFDPMRPAREQLANADAIVDMGGELARQELVDAAQSAKLWQIGKVGYDFFDMDMMRRAGIPVCNCPGSTSAVGLAETALMFMLMIVHNYKEAQDTLAEQQLYRPMGDELEGKILGLIGFGASARALARLAGTVGMRFMIMARRKIEPEALEKYCPEFVGSPSDMNRIFAEADFVSLHLPLNSETKGIVSAEKIALMKPSASFINVARGDLVDQRALYSALLENRIAAIGTDVHAGTHPDSKHPVYRHPRFYALPHVSGTTRATARRRGLVCLENINCIATGAPLQCRVD